MLPAVLLGNSQLRQDDSTINPHFGSSIDLFVFLYRTKYITSCFKFTTRKLSFWKLNDIATSFYDVTSLDSNKKKKVEIIN